MTQMAMVFLVDQLPPSIKERYHTYRTILDILKIKEQEEFVSAYAFEEELEKFKDPISLITNTQDNTSRGLVGSMHIIYILANNFTKEILKEKITEIEGDGIILAMLSSHIPEYRQMVREIAIEKTQGKATMKKVTSLKIIEV